ncbi:MAG TPA: GDSL-type esterase/lipase family protein [Pseudomonadota bacterium]|nr:GDSL-type esterase/lipase family protein [Pseudomonadota bacterium]
MTRSRLAVLSLSLLAACGGGPADEPLGTRQDELLVPTAAVAMGDSFISGEAADNGGVDYLGAVTVPGTSYVIPASNVPGNYCHRSRKASIFLASLPGISARFNLACSGAESKDIASPNTQYSEPAQLDHLAAVARSHDIKLIVLSLGGNDLGFADYLISCMKKFALDAVNPLGGTGCTPSDLPDDAKFQDMKNKVTAAIDRIRTTMRAAGKADTSYRLIVQSYPSPLPGRYADPFHRERTLGIWQYDTNWVFPGLATTRFGYPGCPFHEETGSSFIGASRKASGILKQVASSRGAELLALHDSLNGYGRCERANPDESAITGMLHADNSVWQDILRTGTAGTKPFNVFQESMHPNLRGHQLLGACLGAAYASTATSKQCLPGGLVTSY